MNITQAEYDALVAKGLLPKLKKPVKSSGGMNKTEAAFAAELDALIRDGKVFLWWFEAITLKVAEADPVTKRASYYRPDFLVWWPDGTLEVVEIKGFLRDDARDKFKVAQSMYPFLRFRMVRKKGKGFETIMGSPMPIAA